eukprot:1278124-Amphidinium_carterae.1
MALLLLLTKLLRQNLKLGASFGSLAQSGSGALSRMTPALGTATRSVRSSIAVPPVKREARIDGA